MSNDSTGLAPFGGWRSYLPFALLALTAGCLERRSEPAPTKDDRCTTCHGDPARSGTFLQRSAPPGSASGGTEVAEPAVGAHLQHVYAGETHAAVSCENCHVVPTSTGEAGHADSAAPAELIFAALATTGGLQPSYSSASGSCSDSYCHGDTSPVWTSPRSSEDACGSCHGLPPAAPHPDSNRCVDCHTQVIDAEGRIIDASLHVNGLVDVEQGVCSACHGTPDDPAPPPDLAGNTSPTAPGVGAHGAHLSGGSSGRALACGECHQVPAQGDQSHPDGNLEVLLSGVAATDGRSPTWDSSGSRCSDSWCHSPSGASGQSPVWTSNQALDCTECHGSPPDAPHPPYDNCALCHAQVVNSDNQSILARDLHVNGIVEFESECTACHGSVNPAPPGDLSGNIATTASGVGAHQVHLAGTSRSRAVLCVECHQVPEDVRDPGHMDTEGPAEILFSGVATAFGAMPSYAGGSCSETSCHGGTFTGGNPSGGTLTEPVWTLVDGSQTACGSCHALPPPAPHPAQTACNQCHQNIAADSTFLRPDLHVDGLVTFGLP